MRTKYIILRNKFNKIDLVKIYLKMLGEIEIETIVKNHLAYIVQDISSTRNIELVQRLIIEIYNFISEHKISLEKNDRLNRYVNNTIDLLLEKEYLQEKP